MPEAPGNIKDPGDDDNLRKFLEQERRHLALIRDEDILHQALNRLQTIYTAWRRADEKMARADQEYERKMKDRKWWQRKPAQPAGEREATEERFWHDVRDIEQQAETNQRARDASHRRDDALKQLALEKDRDKGGRSR